MFRKNFWIGFLIIIAIIFLGGYLSYPKTKTFLGKTIETRQGLDLKGGVRLVYQLDFSKQGSGDKNRAISSTVQVIERRVNSTGVVEPLIQPGKVGNDHVVIVELPGIKDVNKAIELIGKTAQLDFREGGSPNQNQVPLSDDTAAQSPQNQWIATGLTGKQLTNASVDFDPTTNKPQVSLKFNSEGAKLFSQITERNIGKPVAIFLDEEIISAPTVQTQITNGEAVITGDFSISEVKELANLLKAGALDVPIKLVEQRTIGATLGQDSVRVSLLAGLIGLVLVALFMLINYRLAGFAALLALIGYTVITLAIFRIIPVTLTLSGIAGFILSIGMAVDANILIFERMREELRAGKDLSIATEEGFRRAWPSVRDSNAATLITCAILYFTTTGSIRGFALTLAIGVMVSLFSSITASRSFIRLFAQAPILAKGLKQV